jgi:predicted PurR-regulated permease PerM
MGADDEKPLAELTLEEARRAAVYGGAALVALALFAALVGQVFVALVLGVVAGAFLVPVQEWLEGRLRARAGSALVTLSLIILPLGAAAGYGWYEVSHYSKEALGRRAEIVEAVGRSLSRYFGVGAEETRARLEEAFAGAVFRAAEAAEEFRDGAALLLVSATVFFFTVFYVLTRRERLVSYVKLRVPGEFLPFYESLSLNVGGALRGALWAVFVDQSAKAAVILAMNLVFGVPLAVALALAAFLVGFFPLLGVWAVYVPVSVYLLVFRDAPTSAAVYFAVGVVITFASSLYLRPRLASEKSAALNFYWMLVALVAGVYTFGVPGVVLGPAILGFSKAVLDTLVGEVSYETSLLKEEMLRDAEAEVISDR